MKTFWLSALLLVVAVPAMAQTVLKKTLPNGLTVLARENRTAPVVAVRLYVKTGSIYEGDHLGSGLSHLFEHTLFEGTATRSKTELNDELQAIGGQSNAYTSYDVTAYHVTTARSYFERAVSILGDMAQNATFPEAEVRVQQSVIHNEMNLGADDPHDTLSQLWNETAFRVHPVRLPIIGFREQFDALSRREILDYYRLHYTPENTILSVSGDVSPLQVFAAAQKEMGAWPRRASLAPVLPTEPRQNAPRRAVVERGVNQTFTQIGWRTVPLQNPDLYALDVMAQILGGNDSSRLPLLLVQQKNLALNVSVSSLTPNYDAGSLIVNAETAPQNAAKVENLIREQIRMLKTNGVSASELARAKTGMRAASILNSQDVDTQAEQAADDEMATGDPNYSRTYVANIQKVTASQILEVARKYLRDDGVTVAVVRPKTSQPLAVASPTSKAGAPARITTLPNGMRLILRPLPGNGTVSFTLMGAGGMRSEPGNKAGIAYLSSLLLTRGTSGARARNAEQIAALTDEVGGSLSPFSGPTVWGIEGRFLSGDWKRGLYLLADSALQPAFPEQELKKMREQALQAFASQDDDPQSAASNLLRRLFYGRHPYSRSILGTPDSVRKITRADVQNFWRATFQPKQTVLAIYGDFDAGVMTQTVNLLFGKVHAQMAPLRPANKPTILPSFTSKVVDRVGISQTVLFYGFPSAKTADADQYAIDVLDAALSGTDTPGGRLHARLRDNQLVYVVHAYSGPVADGGIFVIYAATTPENRAQTKAIIEEEIEKIRQTPLSDSELQRAKSMVISARAINTQTAAAGANEAAATVLFGPGLSENALYAKKIEAVTADQVLAVAQKYLKREHGALAIVEPQTTTELQKSTQTAPKPAPHVAAPASTPVMP